MAEIPTSNLAPTIRDGLARSQRPELVASLLARAADKLRPTGPAPAAPIVQAGK